MSSIVAEDPALVAYCPVMVSLSPAMFLLGQAMVVLSPTKMDEDQIMVAKVPPMVAKGLVIDILISTLVDIGPAN